MILGIGTDIIEIKRIEEAILKNERFLEKVFSEEEIDMFKKRNMKSEVIAGNFSAKEAISKALGTGIRNFSLNEIEILRDELGKPIVKLSSNIEEIIAKNYKISVSISHNKTTAISFAILEDLS